MWSTQSTMMLMQDLKFLPCLWDYNCETYRNRDAKNEALASLSLRYNVPPWEVDKKIQALKNQFRREHNKLLGLRRIGHDAIRTTWFGYKPLSFLLKNHNAPNNDFSPCTSNHHYNDHEQEEFNVESTDEMYADNSVAAGLGIESTTSDESRDRKPQVNEQDEELPEDGSPEDHLQVHLDFPKDHAIRPRLYCRPSPYISPRRTFEVERLSDEYTAIGVSVAAKLRRMDDTQRFYAEMLLTKVLGMGLLSKLSENTEIIEKINPSNAQNSE